MILIGSNAILHWFSFFPRKPKDIDFIVTKLEKDIVHKGENVEFLLNPVFSKKRKYFSSKNPVMLPDDLCTLKASHLCWDINWDKHMWDLQFLLKQGCTIDDELWNELYVHWNSFHAKNKRSDLKMSKEDFFTNNVNKTIEIHDFTHTILNHIPTYTKVLKDGCEVELCPIKFECLPHEDKINFVREEVMVMAYERYSSIGYKHAYNRMLKKFIISHAPIWSVTFILRNYIEIEKCQFDFLLKISNGHTELRNGFRKIKQKT